MEDRGEAVSADIARELQRCRALFTHMQHGFVLCRMVWEGGRPVDFIIVDTNPAFERLTGLRGPVVKGRRVTEVLPGIHEDPAGWIERFGHVAATGEPARLQRFAVPLGRFYDVDVFRPEPDHFAVIFDEVTNQQRAADRMTLLARMNDRLAASSTPADVVEAVFHEGLAHLGARVVTVRTLVSGDELQTVHAIGVAPETVERFWRTRLGDATPATDAVRTGLPQLLGSPEAIRARYPHLVPYFDLGTDKAWAALPLQAGGRCIGSVGLTFAAPQAFSEEDRRFLQMLASKCARALERTMIFEESRRQRAILDTIFEADPGGIAIIAVRPGDEPRFVTANPAYRSMTPDPALDPVGRTVEEVWPASRVGEPTTENVRRLAGEEAGAGQLTLGAGAHARHILYNTRTIPWSEGRAVVVGLWDVTKLHELQEQREDTLRMISHDLRTPLNALVLQAGMLQRSFEPSDGRASRTAKILANAMRMDRMIRELVEMTQLESGQVELRRATVDIGTWARQVVERLEEGERIRVTIEDGLPSVTLDPDRFERALVNLLDNALKYSPPSETVALAARPAAGGVHVEVTDRGPGLAKDDLARVFDRFFRTKDARRKEGLGLGLYITSLLVRAHGGIIDVASEPGRGCTFRVFLPVG